MKAALGRLKSRAMDKIASNRLAQFITYVIIGGLTSIVSIYLLYILTEVFHLWYLASAALSYVFSWVIHYTLNKRITFQNHSRRLARQFTVFLMIALISMALNLVLLSFFVEVLHIWYILAQLLVVFILFFLNYLANRFITFGMIK